MLVWQNHNKCHANDPHEIYTHIPYSVVKTLTICPLETSNLAFLKTTEESSFCVPCLGEWYHHLLITQAPNLKGHYYFSCSLIAHDDGDDLVNKSCPTLVIPWTEACQTPLSMGSPGKTIGVGGLPFSSSGDLPNPGSEPRSPVLQADSLPTELHCTCPFPIQLIRETCWVNIQNVSVSPLPWFRLAQFLLWLILSLMIASCMSLFFFHILIRILLL